MKHKSIKNPSFFTRLAKPDNLLLAICLCLPMAAFAAGGFDQVTGAIKTLRDNIYLIIGLLAGLALLWACLEGWYHGKSWLDIMKMGFWIVGAGASFALAAWGFKIGGSMTF